MRFGFDIHNARFHLIQRLHNAAGVVAMQEDGSDFVLADLWTGERVFFYIVETAISLHEIQLILQDHTAKGWHTVFLFWVDMLLPNEGELFQPQDWMAAMLALYGGKIYGWDVFAGREVHIFPVYFDAVPGQTERLIRYGATVNFDQLRVDEVVTTYGAIAGRWRIADFDADGHEEREQGSEQAQPRSPLRTSLQAYFDLLEIRADADLEMVKAAYRQLARRYHPDVNDTPDAHQKMQAINEAYRQILQKFDPESR